MADSAFWPRRLAPAPSLAILPYCSLQGETMGTTWAVKLSNPAGKIALGALEALIQLALDRIIRQMSTWDADSTISCLNREEPGWYRLPDEFFHVLSRAWDIAEQTGGAYDPTVGRLVDLWGFGPAGAVESMPGDQDIAAALAHSGWRRTRLDRQHRAVWQPGGLQFDLSSIAKGYAVDCIAALLDEHNIGDYLVEVGGELKARGRNRHNAPWALAVETPGHTQYAGHTQHAAHAAMEGFCAGSAAASMDWSVPAPSPQPSLPLALSDCAIATSGDYRRYFRHGGHRYAHTIDPATGRPLTHPLASVSVLHPQCMLADALATALLSLGPERGPAYARSHRIPALFMHRHPDDLSVEWTGGFPALGTIPCN